MLSHPIVMQEIARARNDDLLREAMRYRLAAEAAPRESRVRRALSSVGPVFAQLRQRQVATRQAATRQAATSVIVEPV